MVTIVNDKCIEYSNVAERVDFKSSHRKKKKEKFCNCMVTSVR